MKLPIKAYFERMKATEPVSRIGSVAALVAAVLVFTIAVPATAGSPSVQVQPSPSQLMQTSFDQLREGLRFGHAPP